jgi:hypothetical protein
MNGIKLTQKGRHNSSQLLTLENYSNMNKFFVLMMFSKINWYIGKAAIFHDICANIADFFVDL